MKMALNSISNILLTCAGVPIVMRPKNWYPHQLDNCTLDTESWPSSFRDLFFICRCLQCVSVLTANNNLNCGKCFEGISSKGCSLAQAHPACPCRAERCPHRRAASGATCPLPFTNGTLTRLLSFVKAVQTVDTGFANSNFFVRTVRFTPSVLQFRGKFNLRFLLQIILCLNSWVAEESVHQPAEHPTNLQQNLVTTLKKSSI